MTTEEHLNKIIAKCKALLEFAEKRTPGEWMVTDGVYNYSPEAYQFPEGPSIRFNGEDDILFNLGQEHNAAFIAACAGPAEAMARSTIEAINALTTQRLRFRLECFEIGVQSMNTALNLIIAAWPEELL